MKQIAAVISVAILMGACSSDHTLLHERAAQWRSKLKASVPPGTSVADAKAWGERNGVSFSYLEQQRQLYAVAERIPENGFNRLVCSEWSVLLKIHFSANGLSENSEVSTVGTCL